MPEPEIAVGVEPTVSDAALHTLSAKIAKAIEAGATPQTGWKKLEQSISGVMKQITAAAKAANDAGLKGAHGFEALRDQLKPANQETVKLTQAMLALGRSNEVIGKALSKAASDTRAATASYRQDVIERTRVTDRAGQQQISMARDAAKAEIVAAQGSAQRQIVATRFAGQQRVQITRAVIDNIGRLEKGLAATIAGVARTGVGAVGKIWDGLVGVTRHGANSVENITRSSNNSINNSYRQSLSLREVGIRNYFSHEQRLARANAIVQERITAEQASRQALIRTELSAASRAGVTGAATRAGLIGGGILAGAGAVGALRSTFTIGSDFVRGLAVLQAQLGLTAEQMKSVRQLSINLGNDITLPGVSALDAAQAIQILTKQFGYLGPAAVDAAQKAAKGTLQLARATDATAEQAGAVIGSAVNVFKINADKAVEVADLVAGAISKAAGVSFQDFALSFQQGAAAFSAFVGPAESATDTLLDFNTVLAVLARNGLTGEKAGTGLKQLFINATKQTDEALALTAQLAERAGETGSLFFKADGSARTFSKSMDILRKGIAGYTDEQRTATLNTLFGARSFIIAKALVETTTEDYAKLRDSIAVAGLAAKIAAAQNTGLAGALDALKSVVETVQILFYEKFSPAIGRAVLSLTGFVTKLLFAGGAFAIFREAVLGAAIAIGTLVGIKVAAEALQLLAIAAKSLLTPFGAMIAVVGLLGAGIKLMADHSLPFREALGHIGDAIGGLLGKLRDLAGTGLGLLGDFISRTVIPAVSSLAEWLSTHLVTAIQTVSSFVTGTAIPVITRWAGIIRDDLVGAFQASVRFVSGTVIPALGSFVGFVRSSVIPVVVNLATGIGEQFMAALGVVQRFGQRILPFIQPAIDGFAGLGKAVASAVTGGDFSKLGGAALGVLGGIGQSAVSIWDALFAGLRPAAAKALDFLKDVFTLDHLKVVFFGFLDIVEWIGKTLGTIVSHPAFLAAVAAIAGAAVAIGAKFVQGLIEGIWSNIPTLARILKDAIVGNIGTVVAGVGILLALRPLINVFRSAGAEAGSSFGAGLKGALGGAGGFLSGVTGRTGVTSPLLGPSLHLAAQFDQEATAVENRLRVLGSKANIDVRVGDGLKEGRIEVARFERALTDAQKRGLEFRDRLSASWQGLGTVLRGAGGILGGIKEVGSAFVTLGKDLGQTLLTPFGGSASLTSAAGMMTRFKFAFTTGFKEIGRAWSEMWAGLSQIAQSQGTTIGRVMAAGITSALAVGVTSFFGGRAAGKAGIGATESVLGGALAGGAIGFQLGGLAGLPGVGAAVGAGVGGLATALGHALGAAAREAKEAKDRIQEFASALNTDLGSALTDGTAGLLTYASALEGAATQAQVLAGLKDKLPTLLDLGVGQDQLLNVFKGGQGAVDAFIAHLRDQMGPAPAGQAGPFRAFTNSDTDALLSRQREIQGVIDATTRSWVAYSASVNEANQAEAFRTRDAFNTASTFPNRAAFEAANPLRARATQADLEAFQSQSRLITQPPAEPGGMFGGFQAAWKGFVDGVRQDWADTFEDPQVVARAMEQLNQARAEIGRTPLPLLDDLASIQKAMEDNTLATEDFKAAIAEAFRPQGTSGLTDAINDAILDAQNRFAEIKVGGDIFDQASLDRALRGMNAALQTVVQQGISEGIQPTDESLRFMTGSILTANLAGVTDPNVKQTIIDTYNAAIQAALAAVPPVTVPVTFDLTQANSDIVFQQLPSGGITAPTVPDINIGPAQVKVDTAGINAIVKSQGTAIGSGLTSGIVNGITAGKSQAVSAAIRMANDIAVATREALDIHSPSQVFSEIGRFIGEGLKIGIEDTGDDIADAMASSVEAAVKRGVDAAKSGTAVLRAAGTAMFAAVAGTGAVGAPGGGFGGPTFTTASFTGLISGFQSAFASTIGEAFRVGAQKPEERTPADLNIFGESGFSLDPTDVLGSKNIDAIAAVVDGIKGIGDKMIEAGVPIQQVTDHITDLVGQFEGVASGLGYNADQVASIVDDLGLGTGDLAALAAQVQNMATFTETQASEARQAAIDAHQKAAEEEARQKAEELEQDRLRAEEKQRRERDQGLEALTLSDKDLDVFIRENGLNDQFRQWVLTNRAQVATMTDAELEDYARSMGMWGDAVGRFVDEIDAWTGRIADASTPEVTQLERPQISVTVMPPYGDPVAIGLSAANAVAMLARIP